MRLPGTTIFTRDHDCCCTRRKPGDCKLIPIGAKANVGVAGPTREEPCAPSTVPERPTGGRREAMHTDPEILTHQQIKDVHMRGARASGSANVRGWHTKAV